jgi:hypothetical protein
MYQVDEKPETIHLYVVREQEPRPPILPLILSVLFSLLITFGVITPYRQPVIRAAIRVPAVPLGIRSFRVSVAIIPTGVKTYPATPAHGMLTITNGSIIGQTIPAGFTIQDVATDKAVYVPPGNANGYGYATVPAHALMSGTSGNLPPLTINQVIGSSVYIRNLSAFQGGRDSYSVKFVTDQDKQQALIQARELLTLQINGLHYPCSESYLQTAFVNTVTWRCQIVTYSVPSYMHVLSVRLEGKNLVVDVVFTPPPVRVWVK